MDDLQFHYYLLIKAIYARRSHFSSDRSVHVSSQLKLSLSHWSTDKYSIHQLTEHMIYCGIIVFQILVFANFAKMLQSLGVALLALTRAIYICSPIKQLNLLFILSVFPCSVYCFRAPSILFDRLLLVFLRLNTCPYLWSKSNSLLPLPPSPLLSSSGKRNSLHSVHK